MRQKLLLVAGCLVCLIVDIRSSVFEGSEFGGGTLASNNTSDLPQRLLWWALFGLCRYISTLFSLAPFVRYGAVSGKFWSYRWRRSFGTDGGLLELSP
jgi:hypothetical protein